MTELPRGWASTELDDVADVLDHLRVPVNRKEREQRPGEVPYYGATGQVGWIDRPLFNEELCLLGEDGAPFFESSRAKAYVITGPSWVNNHAHVLRVRPWMATKFLKYALDQVDYHAFVTGTTRPKLTKSAMTRIPLPLPPLAEQQRIVAAIEEQFSRVEAGVNAARRAAQLLPRLRVMVIESGFDVTWPMQRFASVARIVSDLVDPAAHAAAPHIAPNHIESGSGRLLPYATIGADGVTSPKHRFHTGQLLYSKIRPYLKKVVLVDFDGLCSADMYPIETTLDPRFLKLWMLSERFTEAAIAQQGRSVLPKINREALSRLAVPVPPGDVQRATVARLEHQLSVIDELEAKLRVALRRSEVLRRSILGRAFRGELVAHNPEDEPASRLLERIAAERAAPKTQKRRERTTA